MNKPTVRTYAETAIPHLSRVLEKNAEAMEKISAQLVRDVRAGLSLLVFGSGHSAMFPMELYHRAGGPSFVLPVVGDYLMPTAGPPVVRILERTAGAATPLLDRVLPKKGEMLWIGSQSGINAAAVDLAILAKARGLVPIAFTSLEHSRSVASRHSSGKRLFEVCDAAIDLGTPIGDAAIPVASGVSAGPLSTLSTVFVAHSILVAAMAELEQGGMHCTYTSVNTPDGEARNKSLETKASERDFLLR